MSNENAKVNEATQALLQVQGLSIAAEDKTILRNLNLDIEPGTTHILMGPNGAGKSTLGHAIMGNPEYDVTGGSIFFDGQDITDATPDKRAQAGLFLSFQAPVEVPGVPLFTFLRAIVAQRPDLKLRGPKLKRRIAEVMGVLNMDSAYLDRELNVGFSGGEKKKVEMLQLLLLQPKLAILDETDSGLDVDALDIVSRAIRVYQEQGGTLLIITHNTRILDHIDVDTVHVLVKGSVVAHGDSSLIGQIDDEGFEKYIALAAGSAAGATVEAVEPAAYAYPPMTPAAAHLDKSLTVDGGTDTAPESSVLGVDAVIDAKAADAIVGSAPGVCPVESLAMAMADAEDEKAERDAHGDVFANMEAALAEWDAAHGIAPKSADETPAGA